MIKDEYEIFEPFRPDDYLIIDWQPTSICNFSCNYCHPDNYNGNWKDHDLDDCINFVNYINENNNSERKLFFNINGGEPTLWKNLDKFCEHIKKLDKDNIIRLITNGTRGTNWWLDRSNLIDMVIVSIHMDQSKKEIIAEKFNNLYKSGVDVNLHVMMDIQRFDSSLDTYKYLYKNLNGPGLSFRPLRVEIGSHYMQPYTDDQLEQMKNLQIIDSVKYRKQQSEMIWRSVSGKELPINNIDKELIVTKENNWKDWYCNIGIDTIVVNRNGNIKPSSGCFKHLSYGNIKEKNYNLPMVPVKCKFDYCGCLTDLQTKKTKNLKNGEYYIDADIHRSAYNITVRN